MLKKVELDGVVEVVGVDDLAVMVVIEVVVVVMEMKKVEVRVLVK